MVNTIIIAGWMHLFIRSGVQFWFVNFYVLKMDDVESSPVLSINLRYLLAISFAGAESLHDIKIGIAV